MERKPGEAAVVGGPMAVRRNKWGDQTRDANQYNIFRLAQQKKKACEPSHKGTGNIPGKNISNGNTGRKTGGEHKCTGSGGGKGGSVG